MTPLTITKRFAFEAHHKLPWHTGKCARDHGHSYVLDVSVRGPVKPDDGASDAGMVMDFGDLGAVVKAVVTTKLDHFSLNDVCPNPTAENVILWIADELVPLLSGLCRLRLAETATAWVEWEATP